MISTADVRAARRRIAGRVRHTPMLRVSERVSFKLEFLQHSGSFKARGAFNRILAAREAGDLTDAGVVTASGGNAGLAVAYAAAALGVPAEVFVPLNAPPVKVARLHALGARVRQHGEQYAEAYLAAVDRIERTGGLFVHAYDQPEVVAGQGTLGLELAAEPATADTVLVSTGGGGLVAGIAAALEGRATVVAVEPVGAPTLQRALAAGGPVDVPIDSIAADSLGARRIGTIAYEVARRTGLSSVLVDDDDIVTARRRLWHEHRIAVEHGAAAAYAALLAGAYRPGPDERVVVVLCGANTDPADLSTMDSVSAGFGAGPDKR